MKAGLGSARRTLEATTLDVERVAHLIEAVATERSGGRPIDPVSDMRRDGTMKTHKRQLADEHRKVKAAKKTPEWIDLKNLHHCEWTVMFTSSHCDIAPSHCDEPLRAEN